MSNSTPGDLQKKLRHDFSTRHMVGLGLLISCFVILYLFQREDSNPRPVHAGRHSIPVKGQIIPWSSVELYSPQNSFQVDGSSSTSNGIKIVKLVPEGQKVKAGDTIAWFLFTGLDIQNRLVMKSEKIRATLAQTKLQLEEEKVQLEEQWNKADLKVQEEQLNVDRAAFSSRIAQKEAQLALMQARLERTIKKMERASQKQFAADEISYVDTLLRRQEEEFRRFKNFEARYQLKAPTAGVVSYAMNLDANRKVAEGDQMVTGSPVLLLAPSSELGVRFYVKEKFLSRIRLGEKVEVKSSSSARAYTAEIQAIEPFPQELGSLKNSFRDDDSLEKYYVCQAKIAAHAGPFTNGSEVEVVLHADK